MIEEDWPDSWLADAESVVCPNCGVRAGRPILWAMPTGEVAEALEQGVIDIVIGGCVVDLDDPTHRCLRCDTSFHHGTPDDVYRPDP